jgi:DNA-directed RNA polymerase alpha subunit
MTLTEKEIKTLATLNAKKEVYEYVEVKGFGLGGVEKIVNKLQKIGAKAKKFKSSLVIETPDFTMAQITDMDEARRRNARKNNL